MLKPLAELEQLVAAATGDSSNHSDPLSYPDHSLSCQMMAAMRPTRLQEIIRQWILLLPMATAVAGTGIMELARDSEYFNYLPAVFFSGALLVTAAMLHQRRMFRLNLALVERCVANERLTNLHRLSLALNKSLDTMQVAQTVLNHSIQSLSADACALWLRADFVPAGVVGGDALRSIALGEDASGQQHHWHQIASYGFDAPTHRRVLEEWNIALECDESRKNRYHYGVEYRMGDCAVLKHVLGEHDSAISVPILWEGAVIGTLFVASWQRRLQCDDVVLLDAIALATAPALQNARLYYEAKSSADHDSVTNLFNHRAIQQQLHACIDRARRTPSQFGVVMMDLNNFKFFNDTYGHPVGDEVLRTVACCLNEAYRCSDILGRFGGDEFIALLPDTDAAGTVEACKRISDLLSNQCYETEDGTRVPISMSFGWATFPHDGDTPLELISRADTVLYEHKQSGGMSYLNHPQSVTIEIQQELKRLKDRACGGSFGVLDALVTAIDNKDHYTRRHSEEVTGLSLLTARELGFSEEALRTVCISGLLHDIGKIAVPDQILRHPGKLTREEFDIMKQHPVFGALIVKDVPNLDEVLQGVRYHHERWDGNGYPDGLAGTGIPLLGRLLAVADCYSAMTTNRPYRKALTLTAALEEIERSKGKQFDPVIADTFIRVMRRSSGTQAPLPEGIDLVERIVEEIRDGDNVEGIAQDDPASTHGVPTAVSSG